MPPGSVGECTGAFQMQGAAWVLGGTGGGVVGAGREGVGGLLTVDDALQEGGGGL